MSILDALSRGIQHYPGDRKALAARMVRSDDVLRKELSGTAAGNKLGALDAITLARWMVELQTPHCYDYAIAVAAECGGRFEVGLPVSQDDATPVQRVSALMRETSDVASTVIDAMSDQVISDNELARIEREIEEAELVLHQLRATARQVNRMGKPGGGA